MSGPEESGADRYATWDAAYVLGALSPQERREFERHLASCAACRAAVTELAGMPAVLSELSPEQAVALASVPEPVAGETGARVVPLAALAAAARRRSRRGLVWQAAAAVGLVAVGGVGSVVLSDRLPEPGPAGGAVTAVTLAPVGGSEVSADLVLTPSTWGTRMEWSCSYPSSGYGPGSDVVYELVLLDAAGERSVVGTWTGAGDDHASGLLGSSALDLDEISRVELAVGDDVVLAAADLTDA